MSKTDILILIAGLVIMYFSINWVLKDMPKGEINRGHDEECAKWAYPNR